jgi:hypothetical protein
MIKYGIGLMLSLIALISMAHTERYYNLHPDALQKAIAACPQKQPRDVSCDQLKVIALRVNKLAYQLRLNPQEYGKEILALQEAIAKQDNKNAETNKRDLRERLAIVKWLESPKG